MAIKPMVLVDCLMDELIIVRDEMDTLDIQIEKDQSMAQAWVDAKTKLNDLITSYDKAYAAVDLARRKAWINPDIADLHARAGQRVEELSSRPDGDMALVAARHHLSTIANIVEKMVWVQLGVRSVAEKDMLTQKDVCVSDGKQQCYKVWRKLYPDAEL